MQYRNANCDEAEQVYSVVQESINGIYPKFYPQKIVEFFKRLHDVESLKKDIDAGRLYILLEDGEIVGTGSRRDNHITRVYVAPQHQGKGFGSYIMEQLEREIFREYERCELDASIPASIFYENRGYRTAKHVKYDIGDGDSMIYEVMEKLRA